eukprot:TRINITY_DN5241_c0_g3_i2.p1 TRINITY_DN5241_c0_g3~~TRINITY_DN5241_c0_g3_i2.p1  ORF type:complete len:143 (+),score=17.18 TRINITY_DN5241_c0_g3_i2:196-624(+)
MPPKFIMACIVTSFCRATNIYYRNLDLEVKRLVRILDLLLQLPDHIAYQVPTNEEHHTIATFLMKYADKISRECGEDIFLRMLKFLAKAPKAYLCHCVKVLLFLVADESIFFINNDFGDNLCCEFVVLMSFYHESLFFINFV